MTETTSQEDLSLEDRSLEDLSAETFRTQLHKAFSVAIEDDRSIDLELHEVVGLKGDTPRKDKSPFSVLFRGPSDVVLEQQTLQLRNETLGELLLFVVPLGPDLDDPERRILYEAVFT